MLYFRSNYDTGTHTICVCVADCYFIVNVLDLQFASPIAIYRQVCYKSMLNKRWITLPAICGRPFASKQFFERFWRIWSSPFTVPYNRKTRDESLFWKGSSAGAIFSSKVASLRLQTLQQKRSLSYNGSVLWNSLSLKMRQLTSLNVFKGKLKNFNLDICNLCTRPPCKPGFLLLFFVISVFILDSS